MRLGIDDGPQAIASALQTAEEGVVEIFKHYNIDVTKDFVPVWDAFNAAMYIRDDDSEAAAKPDDPE